MKRLKILGLFAALGFIVGIAANATYHEVFPSLLKIYPVILQAEWVLSGLVGAVLATIMVVIWAYVSPSEAS